MTIEQNIAYAADGSMTVTDGNGNATSANSDVTLSLFDDFSRYVDDTVMNGQVPTVGPAWATSGASLPTISGGLLVSSDVGYLYSQQTSPIFEMGCDVSWTGGSDMTVKVMTMSFSTDSSFTLTKLLHFNFSPTDFDLGITLSGAGGIYSINAGPWSVPMKNDGTVYRLKMAMRGNSVAIFGPNGELCGWSDVRIAQFTSSANQAFWEPATAVSGLKSQVVRAWTVKRNSNNLVSPNATNDDYASLGNYFQFGRVVGALNRMGEVDIGVVGAASAFPQIQFGPTNLIVSLAAAASSGDTTVSCTDYISAGTPITIDPGPNQEIQTTTAVSGAGPYTLTVPPLSHNHASGSIVLASAPSSMRAIVTYNQVSRYLTFPYAVSIGGEYLFSPGGPLGAGLYLDSGYNSIIKYSSGAVRLGITNAFATGLSVTGSRPSAATVGKGAQFYDTTLNLPIWSDGAVWRNAAGGAV